MEVCWKKVQRKNVLVKAIILGMLFSVASSSVAGGAAVGKATEVTQIANNVQLLAIAIKEADNLRYTIKQYDAMLKNLKKLPDSVKQQAIAELTALAQVVAQGQGIAYSSAAIDDQYNGAYRDFAYYAAVQRGDGGARDNETYSQRYRAWSQKSQDSIRGALRSANLQAQQFRTESSTLSAIEEQADSAEGLMQLIRAGVSISAMQITQLQKLRELTMSQMQMQAAYAGGRVDREAEAQADFLRAKGKGQPFNPNRSGGLRLDSSMRPSNSER